MENNINNPTPQVEETPKAKKPINTKLIIIIVAIVVIIAAAGIGIAVGSADKDGQKSGNKSDVEAAEKGDSDKDAADKGDKGNDKELIRQAVDRYFRAYYACDMDELEACFPEIMWERIAALLNEEGESFENAEAFLDMAKIGYTKYYENNMTWNIGEYQSLDYEITFYGDAGKTVLDEANKTLRDRYGLEEDIVEEIQILQIDGKAIFTEDEEKLSNAYYCAKVDGEWYLMDPLYYFAGGEIAEYYSCYYW